MRSFARSGGLLEAIGESAVLVSVDAKTAGWSGQWKCKRICLGLGLRAGVFRQCGEIWGRLPRRGR